MYAQPERELDDVELAIAAYEAKYRMASAEALEANARDELRVTCDVEFLMMALHIRDDPPTSLWYVTSP